jgi:D-alanyl-lipoteichoic acid acyltransferase DltB (MBOAT superfamily)
MLFNSMQFAVFFLVVTTLYFAIPHKFRWFLLLASSCYFYMVFVPVYILILGFTIVIDYFAGIFLEESKGKRRRLYLICSLIANIGVLAVFKYYNFINENLSILLHEFGIHNPVPFLSILLPIGLSFHTFQAMSYTIEVYRGKQKAERNFGIYALYVMFYPQLVAGPIERPQNLLHQFREEHFFRHDEVVAGLKQMLWGLFKKIVIADRLALVVNAVYNNAESHSGSTVVLATIFFAFQIYCDFSGYSEIAIGAARVMGFKLMTNFNRPYFSENIAEFWKRWHISLSTWFKDYLYISLGGNRVSKGRWYFNLLFVFLVSGLWHGANWNFIIWGGLNGLYLVAAILFDPLFTRAQNLVPLLRKPFIRKPFNIGFTFVLACIAWVFFRANTFPQAMLILKKMSHPFNALTFTSASTLLYAVLGLIVLLLVETRLEFFPNSFKILNSPKPVVRYTGYAFLVVLILMVGVFDGGQFIYFQF